MDNLQLRRFTNSEIYREYDEIGVDGKEIVNDVTKGDQNSEKEQVNANIQKRSLRTRFDSIEVSFEQGILDQHKSALKMFFQEYIEKVFSSHYHSSIDLKQEVFHGLFLDDNLNVNLTHQIKENHFLDDAEKKLFIQDIYHEQQLDKFLNYVCETNLKEIGYELIWIAHLIWLKYIEVRSTYPTEVMHNKNAKDFSREQAENIFNDSRVKFINFRNRTIEADLKDEEIFQAFKLWLIKYVQTVLLVVDGFYFNPYHQPRYNFPKRQLEKVNSFFYNLEESDGQSSEDSMQYFLQGAPRKRVKF